MLGAYPLGQHHLVDAGATDLPEHYNHLTWRRPGPFVYLQQHGNGIANNANPGGM